MQVKSPISLAIYIFLCFALLRIAFLSMSWRDGRSITYDPAGYYISLPAAFIYHDLEQFAFYDTIGPKYRIGDWQSHTFAVPNGNKTLKYSLGMAVLYSPAFLVADQLAPAWGYERDGYSKPYYFLLSIWSVIVACIGLFFLGRTLLHYFDDLSTALTLFLLVFATNYLAYAAINNLMSHSFLFSLYAILIYCSHHWHRNRSWGNTIGIGVTIGLLALARPTEIIAALVPVLFGCIALRNIPDNLRKLLADWPKLLTATLIIGAIGSFQLIYWKLYTGQWLYYSYQDQGFDWLSPHIWDGLFSFRKGWLIYTPIMIFGILGFYRLYKMKNGLFMPFFFFFLLNTYIVYSWAIWWYGGSLGSRAVIQSYAILAFPLAASIQQIVKAPSRYLQIGFAALALLLIDLNLIMTWQATAPGGPWHAEYMTRKYYSKILGRTVVPMDDHKFLDVKYELGNTRNKRFRPLLNHDFERDTLGLPKGNTQEFSTSPGWSIRLNPNVPEISRTIDLPAYDPHPKAWIRVGAQVVYTQREWNEWKLARMRMLFIRNGQIIGEPSIRLQWLRREWTWHDAYFEYPLRKAFPGGLQAGDQLRIMIDNREPGVPDIFVDDLRVELIEP